MSTLLVIDDEPAILHAFRRVFDRPDRAEKGAGVVLHVNPPGIPGLDVCRPRLLGLSRSSLGNELRTLGTVVERSVCTDEERRAGD